MTSLRRHAVAAVVPILVLTACDGGAAAPDPGPSTVDGLTVPGTDLALGDTATLPVGELGRIDLTVTSIEEGTQGDLRSVGLAEAGERTPYYVGIEVTLVSGPGYGLDVLDYLSARSGDDQAGELTVFEPFPPCQQRVFPTDVSPGTTITSCLPFAVADDAPAVDAVRFDDGDAYQSGDRTEVSWR